MKCELCHAADAKKAIRRKENGEESELYVCEACAAKERTRRQKKAQRTRKGSAPDLSVTLNGEELENPPPFIGAIIDAFHGMVSELEGRMDRGEGEKEAAKPKYRSCAIGRVDAAYLTHGMIHLEGLFLIGELESTKRAMSALGCRLKGAVGATPSEPGHAYELQYLGSPEDSKRILAALLKQERNARVRLAESIPRVFSDAICRSLAILKNCRLLAGAELFDLLSPLRLAAYERMLDGITLKRIEKMMNEVELVQPKDLDIDELDRIDAERADRVNRVFEDVVLNERGEGLLQ